MDDHLSPDSDGGRAGEVRQAIRTAAEEVDRQHLHLAELLFEVHEGRYWAAWGFRSFRQYVRHDCAFSIRKAEQLVEFHRKFVIDLELSREELKTLGWSKLALVASIIDQANQHEILSALRTYSCRQIRRLVQQFRRQDTSVQSTQVAGGSDAIDLSVILACLSDAGPATKPWLLKRPAETEFFVEEEVWEQLCFAFHDGTNVLLIGPSGSGKSELCGLVARAGGRDIERFNFGAMTEPRSSLIGNVHFDPRSGTRFVRSRFADAVQRRESVLLLDELSRAGRDAFNVLLPLLDGQAYLALDESEEGTVVHRADGVCFLATANLGMEYTGADALDAALRDRFPIQIAVDFPPPEKELQLLVSRCAGLNIGEAQRLVDLAARQRSMAREGDFVGMISTRALLAAGRQLAAGVSMRNACQFCVCNHFSSDGGETSERARVEQLVEKDDGPWAFDGSIDFGP